MGIWGAGGEGRSGRLCPWLCEERAKKCEAAAGRRVYRVEVRGSVVSKVDAEGCVPGAQAIESGEQ